MPISNANPILKLNVLNGKSVLRSNGIDQYMFETTAQWPIAHLFILARYDGSTFPGQVKVTGTGDLALWLMGQSGTDHFFNFLWHDNFYKNGVPMAMVMPGRHRIEAAGRGDHLAPGQCRPPLYRYFDHVVPGPANQPRSDPDLEGRHRRGVRFQCVPSGPKGELGDQLPAREMVRGRAGDRLGDAEDAPAVNVTLYTPG